MAECWTIRADVPREVARAALLREVEHLLLQLRGLPCEREPLLLVAQIDVRLRDLRGQRHLGVREIRIDGVRFSARRLDRATRAAEQVDFPRRVEAGRIELQRPTPGRRLLPALRARQRAQVRLAHAHRRRIRGHLRRCLRPLLLQLRTRFAQPRLATAEAAAA